MARCGCARDCGAHADPVCGSDGVVYTSACHLQEAACRRRAHLEPAPPGLCALGEDSTAAWNWGPHLVPQAVGIDLFFLTTFPLFSSPGPFIFLLLSPLSACLCRPCPVLACCSPTLCAPG